MSNLKFDQKPISDSVYWINPGKTLDNNNAHTMVNCITDAQKNGYKFIILDMSELEFLSSAGVGSIIGTVEVSREEGGDIILIHVSDNIKHILEVLDLYEFLTVRENMTEVESLCEVKA